MMTPAGFQHGSVAAIIAVEVGAFARARKLGRIIVAEGGFHIARNPDTVRAPDVAFVRAERLPRQALPGFFPGPPDLAVEVVSPNDRPMEVDEKARDWLAAGCQAVWVIDPQAQTAAVYRPGQEVALLSGDDTLSGDAFLPGFTLRVGDIFAP